MNQSASDDGDVIQASWTDPARFTELFERHYRQIHGFCGRRLGWDDADDVAGETFCRAFEHRRLYDTTRSNARPWLYGIASNVIRSRQRSGHRAARAIVREAVLSREFGDVALSIASSVDARRDLAVVAAALPSMPADEVDALLLHVWEGLSYSEIALAFDVPVGTVRSRIFRIRQRLRSVIDVGGAVGLPAVAGATATGEQGERHES